MTQAATNTEPGAMLRLRREELGLSLEQVAAQLNLKAAVIHQLESQQWDFSVAPTFTRGYLRQYGRLLKLNEADVLRQYDQWLSTLPLPTAMQSFSRKTSRDAAESRFMLATYCLLVLLIGLFLVWFWQTHMLNEQPVSMLPELEISAAPVTDTTAVTTSAPSSQAQPVLIVANEPAGLEPTAQTTGASSATSNAGTSALTAAAPTNGVATVADGAVDGEVDGQVDGQVDSAVDRAVNSQPAATPNTAVLETTPPTGGQTVPATVDLTQPSVAASATPVQTITEPVQQTSPASDAAVAQSVPSNTSQAGSAEIQLQLQFSAQCWVAVIAADGKRLAYSMQNSGQTLTLTGIAPLKVTLGDPAAVTASLNGNSIDLSGYKQGQVTRLTLTGSE